MATEYGWLIEKLDENNSPVWAAFESGSVVWMRDANDACRFAREEDAKQMALSEGGGVIVTEHAFDDGAITPELAVKLIEDSGDVTMLKCGKCIAEPQPNRFLWFFRVRQEDGSQGNLCTEYPTSSEEIATNWAWQQYGRRVLAARRRELTFEEYAGLLMTNRSESDHCKRVYDAMRDLFFRCNPRSQNSWILCSEQLPEEPGSYLVFAPSADDSKPLRTVAWFEPDGTGNKPGWQLLPAPWCSAITHWMHWPNDPPA